MHLRVCDKIIVELKNKIYMENKKFTESTESTEFKESAENVEQKEATEVNESAENAENKENSDDSRVRRSIQWPTCRLSWMPSATSICV